MQRIVALVHDSPATEGYGGRSDQEAGPGGSTATPPAIAVGGISTHLVPLGLMPTSYEELDVRQTTLGELLLRRRIPVSMPGRWIYEVKLDERFLMSSLVHDSEDELARLSLEKLEGDQWRVLVGGLGLGYTAAAALNWGQVESVDVVEFLPEVIDWHRRDLVPTASTLNSDERCHILQGDCFQFIREQASGGYDAVLIDIDDSPEHLLSASHGSFYSEEGLTQARGALRPGGVFALWTAGEELPHFLERMRRVFGSVEAEAVEFNNPLHSFEDVNTVYVAQV
ncbi:MAG: spermidine synthase [Planctomycetota bacterium]|jgi:spermidine synthase